MSKGKGNWKKIAVALTGVAIVLFGALPALLLRLGDMALLEKPRAHAQTAATLSPVGGEVYLVRALQDREQQSDGLLYGKDGDTSRLYLYDGVTLLLATEGAAFFQKQLAEMHEAGVLPLEFYEPLEEMVQNTDASVYSYSRDAAGFITFSIYRDGEQAQDGSLQNSNNCVCTMLMESRTGKIVSFWVGLRIMQAPVPDRQIIENYISYLGLAGLADWDVPEQTEYAQNSLYSASAQAMAFVSVLPYTQNDEVVSLHFYCGVNPVSREKMAKWQALYRELYDA